MPRDGSLRPNPASARTVPASRSCTLKRGTTLHPRRERATLQGIETDAYPGEGAQGARPVAEFWRAYDAHQAAQKK